MRISRDPQAVAAVAAKKLADRRAVAFLTKLELLTATVTSGILTPAEALVAAKGEWPGPLLDFLEMLTEEQALQVQLEWAALVQVDRMHVFILTLASWMSLPDATVDAMFKVA